MCSEKIELMSVLMVWMNFHFDCQEYLKNKCFGANKSHPFFDYAVPKSSNISEYNKGLDFDFIHRYTQTLRLTRDIYQGMPKQLASRGVWGVVDQNFEGLGLKLIGFM